MPEAEQQLLDTQPNQGQSEEDWPEAVPVREAVTPEFLTMISQSTGGFRLAEDPKLSGSGKTGYTIIPEDREQAKTVYFNPDLAHGNRELGIKPWDKVDWEGFTTHEAGHHAREVQEVQDRITKDLKDPENIPEAYRGEPEIEARFLQALWSNAGNGVADMWLESFMGRRPFNSLGNSIREFQTRKGVPETLVGISKPEQLMQILLRSRYLESPEIVGQIRTRAISKSEVGRTSIYQGKGDTDVFEAYQKVLESGAMKAIMDSSYFSMPTRAFVSEAQLDKAYDQKFTAYKKVILQQYLKLVDAELEERKQQKQQEKDGGDQGEEDKKGQGGKTGSSGSQGRGGSSEAVPLTKQEEKELAQQLLKELEEAGKDHDPNQRALSEEEQKQLQQMMQQIKQMAQARKEGKEAEQAGKGQEGPQGLAAIENSAEEFRRLDKENDMRGLAERMGVRQESIRTWGQIKEKYHLEIESLASGIADIFLEDRRLRLEYLKREGEVVPGLEYETIAALISGELDPETKMNVVRNPEFLETEDENVVDQSGSMSGDRLRSAIEMMVIKIEAFKKVRETLEDEQLLTALDEQPLRVGATGFDVKPERITTLEEPLSDEKELKMIDRLSMIKGGTDETGAIQEVYRGLTLHAGNVLKMITVYTDGQGNREGLVPIMQQIEDDDEVIFLVIGLGDDAEAIVASYLDPLRDRDKNIHGITAQTPTEAIPQMVEFYKREVEKKRRQY